MVEISGQLCRQALYQQSRCITSVCDLFNMLEMLLSQTSSTTSCAKSVTQTLLFVNIDMSDAVRLAAVIRSTTYFQINNLTVAVIRRTLPYLLTNQQNYDAYHQVSKVIFLNRTFMFRQHEETLYYILSNLHIAIGACQVINLCRLSIAHRRDRRYQISDCAAVIARPAPKARTMK